jgi:formate hydrogenlyase transcriptional activator
MFAFWHALAVAAWLPGAPESARPEGLATLDRLVARLRVWADNAPENFGHLHHLAAAETERVRGDAAAAFQHYELALELAQRQTSPRHRALVNERYGEFWLGRGEARVAAVFLREARYGYSRWGAGAKVAQLERRNPGLLADAVAVPGAATDPGPLDLQTVVKVAQAVSAEIDLGRLLDRLIHVAVEHAGAERGHLVLEQGGVPVVRTDGGTPLAESRVVPQTLVNLVRRTGETLVLDDGAADTQFAVDPYFARERPRSVICTPVVNQGTRVGALYLENNLAPGVFTAGRAQLLQIIAAQAATAIENARLFAEIRRLQERLEAENVYLAEEIQTQRGFEEIVGRTPALQRALARVEQVAATDSTVLILGETGTGKELIARAIHGHSGRRDRPMVSVNCGAISPGLVESELFGHERGAFTGALARKIGRFELADGGTLFLDEIGDLPLELQVKLLRVLQEGEIQRVGGTQPIRVNVRVVAATHHDLEQAVAAGRFRADLYYRLNVFPIQVPPLRERRDDIPTLVRHFVLKYAARMGKQIDHVSKATLDALSAYHWPGNVRELANIVERSVIVSRGATLELGDWLAAEPAPPKTLKESERDQILAALEQSGWRVSGPRGAALKLGLKPTTLEARMKRLGIARPE